MLPTATTTSTTTPLCGSSSVKFPMYHISFEVSSLNATKSEIMAGKQLKKSNLKEPQQPKNPKKVIDLNKATKPKKIMCPQHEIEFTEPHVKGSRQVLAAG